MTFFYGEQDEDPMTGVPRAVLDSEDETLLYSVVSSLGFMSVQSGSTHVLGMTEELDNAGAAWVHSRDDGNGNLKVGTQRLVVVSDILASYQTTAAWKASADSYGGVNTKAVYLNPSSGSVVQGSGSTVQGSSSSSNTDSTDNTDNPSTGSEGTGSNDSNGGSSTGSETGGDNTGGGGEDEPGGDDH